MLVFDTDTLPQRDRAEAMSSAMRDAAHAKELVHHDPRADVYMRLHSWKFGAIELQRVECSGVNMFRTATQAASDDSSVVAVCLHDEGASLHAQGGSEIHSGPGRLFAVQMTRPYAANNAGPISSWVLRIPFEHLAMSSDQVNRARVQLDSSAVNELLRRHIRQLGRNADSLINDSASSMVGTVTADLTRALLASAAQEDTHAQQALEDTLVFRVKAYIRRHLQDPKLTPAALAGVHHVSERHLYKACAECGMRLESWIISQRLAAAREDLAVPRNLRISIGATSAKWGFTNASHFTHRFRAAYGMSPREWQRANNPDNSRQS